MLNDIIEEIEELEYIEDRIMIDIIIIIVVVIAITIGVIGYFFNQIVENKESNDDK